jgi:bifunctional DNase/RNase
MVTIDLQRIMLLNLGNDFVVLLRSGEDSRALPISIGQFEAQAIAIRLNNLEVPRPLTHDLLKSVVKHFDGALVRVEVCDLRDDTFFAKLIMSRGTRTFEVDSRPSDAIALALRFSVPVLVEDHVMEQAGIILTEDQFKEQAAADGDEAPEESDKPRSPLQELEKRLARAVSEERYEEAAELRDKIQRLSSSN